MPRLRHLLENKKKQYLFAKGALAKLHHEQRRLVTWLQLITKSCTRSVNYVTITDTLSWFKILPLDGSNLILVKVELHRKQKSACGSSSSHQKSHRSLTLTILWNLQNPVKTYLGIIGRQHLIDPRRVALLEEQYEGSKKEPQL